MSKQRKMWTASPGRSSNVLHFSSRQKEFSLKIYIGADHRGFDLKEKIRQNDKELSRNELNILKEKTINFVEFLFKKINES